jgi:hypothetical protein
MTEKLSEWFDIILKKELPRGITIVQIDTADLFKLTSGIKKLEQQLEYHEEYSKNLFTQNRKLIEMLNNEK